MRAKYIFMIAAVILVAVLATVFIGFRRVKATAGPCFSNLRIIQNEKATWMYENGKTTNDIPTWTDLAPYLRLHHDGYGLTNGIPYCPQGGTYTIGKVGEPARCSIGGKDHSLD